MCAWCARSVESDQPMLFAARLSRLVGSLCCHHPVCSTHRGRSCSPRARARRTRNVTHQCAKTMSQAKGKTTGAWSAQHTRASRGSLQAEEIPQRDVLLRVTTACCLQQADVLVVDRITFRPEPSGESERLERSGESRLDPIQARRMVKILR